jgi:hypothetical protein
MKIKIVVTNCLEKSEENMAFLVRELARLQRQGLEARIVQKRRRAWLERGAAVNEARCRCLVCGAIWLTCDPAPVRCVKCGQVERVMRTLLVAERGRKGVTV